MRVITTIVYLAIYILLVHILDAEEWLLYFNLFLLFTIGLLHGSNDLEVYAATSKKSIAVATASYYAITVVATFALYWFSPHLCLTLYILMSSYHFGEELLDTSSNPPVIDRVLPTLIGLSVFMLIFLTNSKEFSLVTDLLVDLRLGSFTLIAATIITLGIAIFYLNAWHNKHRINVSSIKLLATLTGLGLLFWWTDLLTSFTIFFVFWHSLPSLLNQTRRLYGNGNNRLRHYLKKAFPIYAISLVGICILFLCFRESEHLPTYLMLAGITVTSPHIVAISKLYSL